MFSSVNIADREWNNLTLQTMTWLDTGAKTGACEYGKLISSFLKMKVIYTQNEQLQILHLILRHAVNLLLAL